MCDVSDEHGKQFYQEISDVEYCFKGEYSPSLLIDYCWTLVLETFYRLYSQAYFTYVLVISPFT